MLVLFARDRRNADAFPRANEDHVHSAYDIYICAPDTTPPASTPTTAPAGEPSDSTTTTSTTAPTSTTVAAAGDVPGEFLAPFTDAQADTLGIHTHGDGLIHIHPFTDSAAGRNATFGMFLDQVGVSMTNETLTLPDGKTFTEGTTKCQGGKDGQLQVAKWNAVDDAAAGQEAERDRHRGLRPDPPRRQQLVHDRVHAAGLDDSGEVRRRLPGRQRERPRPEHDAATCQRRTRQRAPPAAHPSTLTAVPGAPTSTPDTATSVPASSNQ